MADIIQVATTTGNREDAQRIAAELVDKRLAACVQLGGPITSFYHWEGKLETSQEWMLTVKTTRELYDRVETIGRRADPRAVQLVVPEALKIEPAETQPGRRNQYDQHPENSLRLLACLVRLRC